ncbi:MAG: MlaD family protein [Betaproteobacteria bacterium]
MSQQANYFKLGLFVIGAIAAGVVGLLAIGSGRWFVNKITIETYFNESVQGLDIGSKMKYRGVVIGEVTAIGFTYNVYQQEMPMTQRARYVMVEAQLQPRLVGGRAAAGDLTNPGNAAMEVARGLRVRLAPQGITGTNYLEVDYVDPPPPVLPIQWQPTSIYIPSSPSTVTAFVNAAQEIIERLHRLDIEGTVNNLNTLLVTANSRIGALDTADLGKRATTTLGKLDSALDGLQARQLSEEAKSLMADLRATNTELRKTLGNPALQKLPEDASAAINSVRTLVSDPKIASSIAHLERSLTRLDRIVGGGESDLTTTIDNLRRITDNLRDLTEDAKRYPSNLLFGQPPRPVERSP